MLFGSKKQKGALDQSAVLRALSRVQDPDLHKDIVSLGFIKNLVIKDKKVSFDLELTTPACPVKDQLKAQCESELRKLGASSVKVNLTAKVRAGRTGKQALVGVRNIIAVAGGKGGVGKSTVAMNLALALKQSGAKCGLLDCDIYGPSLPALIGSHPQARAMPDNRLVPLLFADMPVMSMGFLIDPNRGVSWRGPMIHKMIQQFLSGTAWPELDYLILDLPPGTGDVQLSLTQAAPISGAVIVTTPQEAALSDARKAIAMFRQVQTPVLGVVENMSWYACRKCDKKHFLFGQDGGARLAEEFQLPLLAQLPLDPEVARGCEEGQPLLLRRKNGHGVEAFRELASKSAAELSKFAVREDWAVPGPDAVEV